MQCATRKPGVIVAATLALAAGSAASAGDGASAAVQPVEELQQLDQIWVRGKSLSDMIEDAEDAFVRRYNKVNKKNNFDVVCGYLRLDRNSLALSRTCVPHFIGYMSMPAMPVFPSSSCMGGYSGGGSIPYYGGPNVGMGISSNDYYGASCASMSTPTIGRRPVSAYTDNMRQEYWRTVMRAIYRDQALLDGATTLAALYHEMKTVQDHYQKIKDEEQARKQAARRERREQHRQDSAQPSRPNNPRL
jgi:hypothetical protein